MFYLVFGREEGLVDLDLGKQFWDWALGLDSGTRLRGLAACFTTNLLLVSFHTNVFGHDLVLRLPKYLPDKRLYISLPVTPTSHLLPLLT